MTKTLYSEYIKQCGNDVNDVEVSYLCYSDYDD